MGNISISSPGSSKDQDQTRQMGGEKAQGISGRCSTAISKRQSGLTISS